MFCVFMSLSLPGSSVSALSQLYTACSAVFNHSPSVTDGEVKQRLSYCEAETGFTLTLSKSEREIQVLHLTNHLQDG